MIQDTTSQQSALLEPCSHTVTLCACRYWGVCRVLGMLSSILWVTCSTQADCSAVHVVHSRTAHCTLHGLQSYHHGCHQTILSVHTASRMQPLLCYNPTAMQDLVRTPKTCPDSLLYACLWKHCRPEDSKTGIAVRYHTRNLNKTQILHKRHGCKVTQQHIKQQIRPTSA